jgi:hypothetical protein
MADNLGYTPGSGATVATDEVAGFHYQRVKPVHGADGVVQDVSEATPMPVADDDSRNLLRRILQMLVAPLGYDKAQGRQRSTAVIESGTVTTVATVTTVTTVTTVSTVSSVANIASIGGYSAQMQIMDGNRTAWAQCVRARIT